MSLSDLPTLMAAQGFTERDEPISLFEEWFKDAGKKEPNDANAMALATVDEEGLPNVRMVLLKAVDGRGFVFYTNFESQKGQELLYGYRLYWGAEPPASWCECHTGFVEDANRLDLGST